MALVKRKSIERDKENERGSGGERENEVRREEESRVLESGKGRAQELVGQLGLDLGPSTGDEGQAGGGERFPGLPVLQAPWAPGGLMGYQVGVSGGLLARGS
ncbi:predicted protein [Histoplasma capsulatum H143]|uniref:Uncharacterized protein n=1 Tax=Ajellomyces capsulatus (strain H143) TaxID=544712 RepID=C6HMT7_AJECH|nr:predicted protein [Histoplasma capsulatum H143]